MAGRYAKTVSPEFVWLLPFGQRTDTAQGTTKFHSHCKGSVAIYAGGDDKLDVHPELKAQWEARRAKTR